MLLDDTLIYLIIGDNGASAEGTIQGAVNEVIRPVPAGEHPVTDDYTAGGTRFTGTVKWIEMAAGGDSHDHLIDPADFLRVAMWKQ